MSDFVKVTDGTGSEIATDLISGVNYQVVKLAFGDDGSASYVGTLGLPVSLVGSVNIGNFPTTQAVSGTVAVSNFPSSQTVAGTVSIGNFPATQPVSGSVSVSNLPATQPISAASLPLPTGAATDATVSGLATVIGAGAPITDTPAQIHAALGQLANPIWEEAATGRLRVVLDPLGGAQTLAAVTTVTTVTTVSTVTNVAQFGSNPINSLLADVMNNAYYNGPRRQIV